MEGMSNTVFVGFGFTLIMELNHFWKLFFGVCDAENLYKLDVDDVETSLFAC